MSKLLPNWCSGLALIIVVGLAAGWAWWGRSLFRKPSGGTQLAHPMAGTPLAPPPMPARPIPPTAAPDSPAQSLRRELVSASQRLAQAQQVALDGVADEDQPAVLEQFAEEHRDTLTQISAMQATLRDPAFNPAARDVLPEAASAQARFAAVRNLILNEGMSLEEAEARIDEMNQHQ